MWRHRAPASVMRASRSGRVRLGAGAASSARVGEDRTQITCTGGVELVGETQISLDFGSPPRVPTGGRTLCYSGVGSSRPARRRRALTPGRIPQRVRSLSPRPLGSIESLGAARRVRRGPAARKGPGPTPGGMASDRDTQSRPTGGWSGRERLPNERHHMEHSGLNNQRTISPCEKTVSSPTGSLGPCPPVVAPSPAVSARRSPVLRQATVAPWGQVASNRHHPPARASDAGARLPWARRTLKVVRPLPDRLRRVRAQLAEADASWPRSAMPHSSIAPTHCGR